MLCIASPLAYTDAAALHICVKMLCSAAPEGEPWADQAVPYVQHVGLSCKRCTLLPPHPSTLTEHEQLATLAGRQLCLRCILTLRRTHLLP
jgi:hypothetical protein